MWNYMHAAPWLIYDREFEDSECENYPPQKDQAACANLEDELDWGGDYGRGRDPVMEAGGGSEVRSTTEAREATPNTFLEGAHGEIGGVRV